MSQRLCLYEWSLTLLKRKREDGIAHQAHLLPSWETNKCTTYRCAGQYNEISFSSAVIQLQLNCLLHNGLITDTGDTDYAKTYLHQQQLHVQRGSSLQNMTSHPLLLTQFHLSTSIPAAKRCVNPYSKPGSYWAAAEERAQSRQRYHQFMGFSLHVGLIAKEW